MPTTSNPTHPASRKRRLRKRKMIKVSQLLKTVPTADGELDRDRMRQLVFGDPAARALLEGITHPLIRAARDDWMARQEVAGEELVVAEIPLLFETGMQDEFDVVVLVDADASLRRERMVATRGLDPAEADRIIGSQMDPARKRALADHVLENRGSMTELRAAALALLARLRGEPELTS